MAEPFYLLIVEDNPDEIALLEEILKQNFPSWTYYFVNNSHELMVFLETGAPVSLILLDVNLPQKDGVSIVREIRQVLAYKYLPVVGFSNASSRATIDSLLLGGASAFFQKPIGIEAMISFLQKLPAFSSRW